MLMRTLFFIAAIVLLVLAVRSLLPRPRGKSSRKDQAVEKMVSCAQCRLYLPQSEALSADENFFCNREHHHTWLADHRKK
jgi:uncharacterized protein